jgi:hypothetical protein
VLELVEHLHALLVLDALGLEPGDDLALELVELGVEHHPGFSSVASTEESTSRA